MLLGLDAAAHRHDALGLGEVDGLLRLLEGRFHRLPDRAGLHGRRERPHRRRRRAPLQRVGPERADLEADEVRRGTGGGDVGHELPLEHRTHERQPAVPRPDPHAVGDERTAEPSREPSNSRLIVVGGENRSLRRRSRPPPRTPARKPSACLSPSSGGDVRTDSTSAAASSPPTAPRSAPATATRTGRPICWAATRASQLALLRTPSRCSAITSTMSYAHLARRASPAAPLPAQPDPPGVRAVPGPGSRAGVRSPAPLRAAP